MENLEAIDISSVDFLKGPRRLPPLPECVIKIQDMILQPDVSVDSISRVLISDPVLTAHVLRVVNSAYYGMMHKVDDIKFAVAYLGIHEIYNIVLAQSVVKTIGIEETEDLEIFWSHSILTALTARYLGKKFEPLISPDHLWLGAILHDIGKLVYMRFFPGHYRAVKMFSRKHGVLFNEGEKYFNLPSSGCLGGILCDRWQLPAVVKDACEGHGIENLGIKDGGSRGDFLRIVSAASLMSALSMNDLNQDVKQNMFDRLKNHFNMDEKDFLKLMGKVYDLKLDLASYRW